MCIQPQFNNVNVDESPHFSGRKGKWQFWGLTCREHRPRLNVIEKKWRAKMKTGKCAKTQSGLIYLSDKQLANRYGVTRTTIWRWSRVNQFPKPVRLGSGCTRWALRAVEAWEERRESDD